MMRNAQVLAGALAASFLALAPLGANAADDPVELRFSIWLPPSHSNVVMANKWGESIAKASGGSIKVTVYPAQQLGKAFDHHDMVRDGIADVGMINTGYEPGRHPIAGVTQIPFMMSNATGGSLAFDEWYRKYVSKDMPDVRFCLGYAHDPGALHAKKKITLPEQLKGMKIRPAHSTMSDYVTSLGATTVQASAPQARDVLAKGVADAITFPWGSILLFGIENAVNYHMDVPLYVTTFAWLINPAKYNGMSAAQKKVIDDHCNQSWAAQVANPWAAFEAAGKDKLAKMEGHTVYKISDTELAAWRKAAEPLLATWKERAKSRGIDPEAALKEFRADLKKHDALY